MPGVFNPQQRPWVNLESANNTSIVETVKTCPSGALSLANDHQESASEGDINITVTKAGPLLIDGNLSITQSDGQVVEKQGVTAFCRCGASDNKPFCDGSHKNVEFDM